MKKLLLCIILCFTHLLAKEQFYGITLGEYLTDDFKPALGQRRGDFHYWKPLDETFQYMYAKVDENKKIIGIMLFKQSDDDVENEKFFKVALLKLEEKYGAFSCKATKDMHMGINREKCIRKYKDYSIDASWSNSSRNLNLYNMGSVRITYEIIQSIESLNKL